MSVVIHLQPAEGTIAIFELYSLHHLDLQETMFKGSLILSEGFMEHCMVTHDAKPALNKNLGTLGHLIKYASFLCHALLFS